VNLETKAAQLLADYEAAHQKVIAHRRKHGDAIDKLEALQAAEQNVVDALKALFATKGEPPPVDLPTGQSSLVWAKGNAFEVLVTYPRGKDTFDPLLLPNSVLLEPGVVTAIDAQRVGELADKYQGVDKARIPGGWLTPKVTLRPR